MTIKSSALLALIGTALVTLLLVVAFILDLINVMQGAVAIAVLLRSLIYAFGSLTVAVFFYVFYKSQP
jgi:uncharacterized membrane protein